MGCRGPQLLIIGQKWCYGMWLAGIKSLPLKWCQNNTLDDYGFLRTFFSKMGCRGRQFFIIGQKWCCGMWQPGIKSLPKPKLKVLKFSNMAWNDPKMILLTFHGFLKIFIFKNGVEGTSIFDYKSKMVLWNVAGGLKKPPKTRTKCAKRLKYGLKSFQEDTLDDPWFPQTFFFKNGL